MEVKIKEIKGKERERKKKGNQDLARLPDTLPKDWFQSKFFKHMDTSTVKAASNHMYLLELECAKHL